MPTAEDSFEDDVDARFAELIRDDYGTEVKPGKAPHEGEVAPMRRLMAPPTSWRSSGRSGTVLDDFDAADAEWDEREGTDYTPVALAPMRRWSLLTSAGVLLAVIGLAVAITGLVISLPSWVAAVGAMAVSVGLSALIVAAFRRKGELSEGDDGARV